jgi:GNAT superfamily N-acetyltransferase
VVLHRYRPALPSDAVACVELRAKTRENAVPAERLAAVGITAESWANDIATGKLPGHVCTANDELAGYCFGDRETGEVVVLALTPQFECQGIGKELLARVVSDLASCGHRRLFLGCSSDPTTRSYGFYRHLGWVSTGALDKFRDEVLELRVAEPSQ